jgi:DNA-binding CsgD family transcriptional regulator
MPYSIITHFILAYIVMLPLLEYPYLLLLWKIHTITPFIWYLLPALGAMLFLPVKSILRWVIYCFVLVCSAFLIAPLIPAEYVAHLSFVQIDTLNMMSVVICLFMMCFFLYYLDKIYKEKNIIWNEEQHKTLYSLQHTVLATSLALSQKQDILDNLVENTDNLDNSVKTMLRDNKNLEKNINNFKEIVANVHPNFFRNLEHQAQPNHLTALDIKYCVYIYMGFSNRDIADALNVEIESVKGKKKNLKRKLKLSAADNLGTFIRMIEGKNENTNAALVI